VGTHVAPDDWARRFNNLAGSTEVRISASNTVSAKTIKNYVGEVRAPSSQPPEPVNIRVRTV